MADRGLLRLLWNAVGDALRTSSRTSGTHPAEPGTTPTPGARRPSAPAPKPKPKPRPKAPRSTGGHPTGTTPRPADRRAPSPVPGPASASGYPGDYEHMPRVEYSPVAGNRPDPGEVVWAWVPYEDDHSQGKDRPVLLVARDGCWLLGLPLTSKDHDRDATQEARAGRFWMDIGTGAWDSQRRPSEVRVDRVVRIDPDGVRRTSVAIDRRIFDAVATAMRVHLH